MSGLQEVSRTVPLKPCSKTFPVVVLAGAAQANRGRSDPWPPGCGTVRGGDRAAIVRGINVYGDMRARTGFPSSIPPNMKCLVPGGLGLESRWGAWAGCSASTPGVARAARSLGSGRWSRRLRARGAPQESERKLRCFRARSQRGRSPQPRALKGVALGQQTRPPRGSDTRPR